MTGLAHAGFSFILQCWPFGLLHRVVPLKPGHQTGISQQFLMNDLDRHLAVDAPLVRAVYPSSGAHADQSFQLKVDVETAYLCTYC